MKKKLILLFKMLSIYSCIGVLLQALLLNMLLAGNNVAQVVKSVKEVYINIDFNNASLEKTFKIIESSTTFKFAYEKEDLDQNIRINLRARNQTLESVLLEISRVSSLQFRQVNHGIDVKKAEKSTVEPREIEVIIQTRAVTGKVTSQEDGEGLPGVNVVEKGTLNGTVTNVEGWYSFQVSEGAVLIFSSVGYTTEEVPVSGRSIINLSMAPDIKSLEEIVVIGYGMQEKVNLTGSITMVNAKEMADINVPTLPQAMMGRTPGVFIKNVGGQPGDDKINMSIRGFGDPLIIVDGMPVSQSYFRQINASDIEQFNVLKDAAAASVYGARAGNGVILITTKRGNVSAPQFTYSSNFSAQYITQIPQQVSSAQFAEMENVAFFNDGLPPPWSHEEIQKFRDGSDPLNYPNSDFMSAILRKYAPQSQHNISVRGGTDNVKYFTSAGFFNQRGMLRSDEINHNRFSLRSNLDVALSKKLDMGLDLSFTNQHYIGPRHQLERTASTVGIMTRIFRSKSIWPLIDSYPDPSYLPSIGGGGSTNNPVNLMYMDRTGFKEWNKLFGYAKLKFEYDLPFGVQAKAIYDFNRTTHRFKDKQRKGEEYDYDPETGQYTLVFVVNPNTILTETNEINNNINQQYFLTWDKQAGDHALSVLTVYERLASNTDYLEANRRNFELEMDYLFAGPVEDQRNNGYARVGGRVAYIGRINYNFQGKYMVELNSRWDASPNFPKESRWGFFPSASIGWRISEEGFVRDNLPFVNNLKVRASHGNLGYDAAGDFQYLNTFNIGSSFIYDGITNSMVRGISPSVLPNPDITWEKMTTSNVGIDFNMFGNMLEGSFDYFYRKRSDVLGQRSSSVPNVVGANLPRQNYEQYDNRGWELMLNHNNRLGEIKYNIGGNISWNREKVLFVDQVDFTTQEARRTGNRIGEWTDILWRLPTDGLFQSWEEIEGWADIDGKNNVTIIPGDVKYVDYNGDGRITNEDRIIIGRGVMPRFTYGIDAGISLKGFELSMLWQGAGLYNFTLLDPNPGTATGYISMPLYSNYSPITHMYENYYVPENEWIPANTGARFPIYRRDNKGAHRSYQDSQLWMINGSYIRLKNVQLSYTLSNQLTKRLGINNLRLFVSGYNVLTFSELDFVDPEIDTAPERTFGDYHPPLGSYSAGLGFNF